jgi:WD40 repeat protein
VDSVLLSPKYQFEKTVSLPGHRQSVTTFALDVDNPDILYSGSYDGCIIAWSLSTKSAVLNRRIVQSGQLLSLQRVVPRKPIRYPNEEEQHGGSILIASDNSGRMHLVVPGTLEVIKSHRIHTAYSWCVYSLNASQRYRDNDVAISASGDGTVIIWNLHTGEKLAKNPDAGKCIMCIDPIPENDVVFAGRDNGEIVVYSLKDLFPVCFFF